MTDSKNDPERADLHADKYNDPRAKITRRGVLMGLGVLLLGMIGAALSISARKTRLVKSRKFWGDATITALQLGERIQMTSIGDREFDPVELTATPGLGHLRHALLDERNYDWSTVQSTGFEDACAQDESFCVQLLLTDPTAHRFEPVEINIDLKGGWIGPSDGSSCVQSLKTKALEKFLGTLVTVQQLRYDHRKDQE